MALYGNHRHTPQIDEWVLKTLYFLYSVKDDGKEYDIRDVFNEMGIPEAIKGNVYAIIRHEMGFIDIASATNKWVSKINEDGIAFVEQKQEDAFQKNQTVPYMQMVDTPLSETFELIFQKHISSSFQVTWTKMTFSPNIPRNLYSARAMMIEDGILFLKSGSKPETTILSSSIVNCKTYEEAKKILTEAKNKTQGNSVSMRDGVVLVNSQASNSDFNFQPSQAPPITPTIAETKQGTIKAIIKFILNNIIVVIFGVIAAVIAGYLLYIYGWN